MRPRIGDDLLVELHERDNRMLALGFTTENVRIDPCFFHWKYYRF